MAAMISSTTKRNLVISLLAILVVLVYLFLPERGRQGEVVLIPAVKEKVDRIRIKQKDKDFSVILQEGGWVMEEKSFPVDKVKMDKMVEFISQEHRVELVTTAKIYAPYGLDAEGRVEIEFSSGDKVLKKVWVGKSANQFGSFYAVIGDNETVYQVRFDRYSLDYQEKDLLDLKVFDFSPPSATQIAVADGKKRWELDRVERKVGTNEGNTEKDWMDKNEKVYPKEQVNDIINTMSVLNAEGMESMLPTSLKGKIDNPLRKIKVVLETGGVREIDILDRESEIYWVKVPDKSFYYKVNSKDGEKLLISLSPLSK